MYEQVCRNDLEVALLFFTSLPDDQRGVVIQCKSASDIPYIKHNIRHIMGSPDRYVGNCLYYDRRPILIISLSEYDPEGRSYDEDTLFLVEMHSQDNDSM